VATKRAVTAANVLESYELGQRDFFDVEIIDKVVDFGGRDLTGINLSSHNLANADFTEATLTSATFIGADLTSARLDYADLTGANLRRAQLQHARFHGSDLTGAVLDEAILGRADLTLADLSASSLKAVSLRGALLESTNLFNAILQDAHLEFAQFKHANLAGVRSSGAFLRDTLLLDVDLRPFCCADVVHEGPSHVNFQSIIRSVGERGLKPFLRRTGMPDVFVEYMVDCARSLEPGGMFTLLQSTFISYGGPDEAFAKKLNEALERRGVNTFFFKDDAVPGERLHRVMRKGVNEFDRVILICSEASLNRPGLLNELQETLAREARDGGRAYLLPVRLDNYVIDGWRPADAELARAVRDRVIADFREHDEPRQFDEQLARLLGGLKRPFANPVGSSE
jgi:uncharacterized protein YjbI with pentapeptide repeats